MCQSSRLRLLRRDARTYEIDWYRKMWYGIRMSDLSKLSDREFRRWLEKRLVVDQPLQPTDELYQPLYEGVAGNPIDLLFEDIDLSEVESLNFISGFRGSGKTTELFRLKQRLEDEGYFVAYANALDYLLPSDPVEISDLLLVLAGAFSDAIEKTLHLDLAGEGFWTRFVHFLTKTKVQMDGIEFKAGIPGSDVGVNFKTSLKEDRSFRKQLRQKLAARLGELRSEVHKFFEFGRKQIRDAQGRDRGVVFIFDQFEQLRDTLDTEGRVAESVAMLMANHRADLHVPLMHMVFTVPPWLKFKLPEMRKIRLLYNVKLWNNNPKRTPVKAGWATMQGVIGRRFTPEGMIRYFGKPTKSGKYSLADKLIGASGGHFRDMVYLLRESLLRAEVLPIAPAIVAAAIASLRDSFLPMSLLDARLLHDIGQQRDCLLQDSTPGNVQRMTLFLDTHCALILRNGDEWYDVHPLIRDEVAEIILREANARKS